MGDVGKAENAMDTMFEILDKPSLIDINDRKS
jgi:hypothetical protein